MTVVALIVTYNRLQLLQECIQSIRLQSSRVSQIVVVNNSSTDGTTEWLQLQPDVLMVLQPNGGGSAGFHRGIKEAVALNPDWIWVMDDDTIPSQRALAALTSVLGKLEDKPFTTGFLSSKVVWTDGAQHNKNTTPFLSKEALGIDGVRAIRSGTFVSLLLSTAAVRKVGLPLKDFFIWYDDVEFTERITKNGFKGFLVEESIVTHKTPDNLVNTIYSDDKKAAWKYFYGTRNYLYLRKQKKGAFIYYAYVLKNFFYVPLLLLNKRKNARWHFIKILWKGTLASLTFQPQKELLPGQETR
ncbi:MAG: hypothetical protein JWP69_1186 [Flaviaesturariibacter sp.]|nr:hypothetical protein [Flaviaesturariibacter sp.]